MSGEQEQPGRFVRVRTSQERRKALAQLADLRNSGQLQRAVVIAELKDGSIQVLGQEATPADTSVLVLEAARALVEVAERIPPDKMGPRGRPEPGVYAPPGAKPGQDPFAPFSPAGPGPYPGEPDGLVNKGWRSFAEAVVPRDAPPVQRVETRKAFYAGAQILLHSILGALSAGDQPTPEGAEAGSGEAAAEAMGAKLEGVARELELFAKAVGERRA